MALTGRGAVMTPQVPSIAGGISIARGGFDVNGTFAGATDIAELSVVCGTHATQPATFADLADTIVRKMTEADRLSVQTPDETIYSGSFLVNNGIVGTVTAGEKMWVCLCAAASPSSGDALVVLAGPITVAA